MEVHLVIAGPLLKIEVTRLFFCHAVGDSEFLELLPGEVAEVCPFSPPCNAEFLGIWWRGGLVEYVGTPAQVWFPLAVFEFFITLAPCDSVVRCDFSTHG